ncbi:hypothetical protein M426DRAFT_147098 [Hypoxylon sp. CI-4A]|nr:hypothetical protein M426DRAFT_147098 [Hypoxylon sp. CI-4A]
MMEFDIITDLQNALANTSLEATHLNVPFREVLKNVAASKSLHFSEDSAGNIYIIRRGKDSELAPIAVSFSLDHGPTESIFASAVRIFSILSEADLHCDLMLVGWTYLDSTLVGRELWDKSITTAHNGAPPELNIFREMESPENMPISAIFEVSEKEGIALRVEGSPILVEKVRKFTTDQTSLHVSEKQLTRAPSVTVVGPGAESIACSMIKEYSAYIVALFDNFD